MKSYSSHLIDDILNDLGLKHVKDGKETPAASSRILRRNDDGVDHDRSFHYRSVIGKLNYLEKATRPDISFATHQCACFAAAPKKSHAQAVLIQFPPEMVENWWRYGGELVTK